MKNEKYKELCSKILYEMEEKLREAILEELLFSPLDLLFRILMLYPIKNERDTKKINELKYFVFQDEKSLSYLRTFLEGEDFYLIFYNFLKQLYDNNAYYNIDNIKEENEKIKNEAANIISYILG
jgi:hypothetical protein